MLNTLKEKLRFQGRLSKKTAIGGGIFLLLLISLPVALFLVNQNQDTRQQAAGTGTETKFELDLKGEASTTTTTPPQILKGSTFEVRLFFSAKGKNVVNLRTKVNYDVTKFTLNSVDTAGSAFQTVNSNTNTAGSAIILAEMNPTTPLTTDRQLVATLRFTATNNANQLGTGTMFLSDPTEITQQNPGGTTTTLLTYETNPVTYNVVSSLPVSTATSTPIITQGGTFPTGYKTPIVITSLVTISNSSRTFNSAVYAYGHTVSVVYRWGSVGSATCQNLPNTINGPVNITGGNAAISPNATPATGVAFPQNSVVYYCASITYGNNVSKFGKVAQFNNGIVGGQNPTNTSTPTLTPTKSPTPTLTPTKTPTPTITPTLPAGVTATPTLTPTKSPTPTITQPITTLTSTPTLTFTPTAAPNQTLLQIETRLPGIGAAVTSGDNNNPSHTRIFDVYLFSQGNTEVKKIPTEFFYENGIYAGTPVIKDVPFNTPYVIKIKTDNSLLKNIGFVTPESQKNYYLDATGADKRIAVGKLSTTNTPNALGIEDYQAFMNCYNKLPVCTTVIAKKADFNDDGMIDLKDRNILIRSFVRVQGD